MPGDARSERQSAPRSVRVWDIPVRVFHWSLVALIIVSFTTAQIGGNAMRIHELSGFTILTLVLFRVLWGLFGSTHARFSDFVRRPRHAIEYARALRRGQPAFYAGHNPLGGWMIVALLLCLLLQAGTGLFANDDIMTEGPLYDWVSKRTSDLLSEIHEVNFYVLAVLIALHVAAAFYYLWGKRENLILPLFTGRKHLPRAHDVPASRAAPLWLAALLLALCAGGVYFLVR
ncbi:MAG TPA: cytochrome b/b6 domain-containing protein [Burkholderiales bacterium]|nr:cytochrome b/b6 domain-containing protein [Burkholderiales bacterium]